MPYTVASITIYSNTRIWDPIIRLGRQKVCYIHVPQRFGLLGRNYPQALLSHSQTTSHTSNLNTARTRTWTTGLSTECTLSSTKEKKKQAQMMASPLTYAAMQEMMNGVIYPSPTRAVGWGNEPSAKSRACCNSSWRTGLVAQISFFANEVAIDKITIPWQSLVIHCFSNGNRASGST